MKKRLKKKNGQNSSRANNGLFIIECKERSRRARENQRSTWLLASAARAYQRGASHTGYEVFRLPSSSQYSDLAVDNRPLALSSIDGLSPTRPIESPKTDVCKVSEASSKRTMRTLPLASEGRREVLPSLFDMDSAAESLLLPSKGGPWSSSSTVWDMFCGATVSLLLQSDESLWSSSSAA